MPAGSAPAHRGMGRATPNKHKHPTLHSVVFKFRTEERTREHVAQASWPLGVECAKCQKRDVRRVKSKCRRNRHLYWCLSCEKAIQCHLEQPKSSRNP